MKRNVLISCQKLFSFLKYLHFCPDFFGYIEKWLDKKGKFNFKIYDVTDQTKISYHT